MRLWQYFILIVMGFILNALATEVVYMDYGDVDTGCISVYEVDKEECNCNYGNRYLNGYR